MILTGQKDFYPKNNVSSQDRRLVENIIKGFLNLAPQSPHIPCSHHNHKDPIVGSEVFNQTTFLYDLAVFMMALNQTGFKNECESILDFLIEAHGFKGMSAEINGRQAFRNAFNRTNGDGILEWWVTPGPTAFLIFALLDIGRSCGDADKKNLAMNLAVDLGKAVLSMQHEDGAIVDGNRGKDKYGTERIVYTEPHLDAYAAFLRLYAATESSQWLEASDKAFRFFQNRLSNLSTGFIFQGLKDDNINTIHATDAFTWFFLGPGLFKISPEDLIQTVEYNLQKCLVKVRLNLPDGRWLDVYGADFTDPSDENIIDERSGFHPMVSIEWTAGLVSSLHMSAIRLHKEYLQTQNEHFAQKSKEFLAIADQLLESIKKCFYRTKDSGDGLIGFYATSQNIPIGHGWNSFYYHTPDIQGGSLASVWVIFPILNYNPFSGFSYADEMMRLRVEQYSEDDAQHLIDRYVFKRSYKERNITSC